jgi:hypothetical protein
MTRIDSQRQNELVGHIWGDADAGQFPDIVNLHELRESELNGKDMAEHLPALNKLDADDGKNARDMYETVLQELFEKDMDINPWHAKLLGLVDWVVGV